MDKMELYWAAVHNITAILNLMLESWFFYRFAKPFLILKNSASQSHLEQCVQNTYCFNKKAYYVGISYFVVMLILYLVPVEIVYPRLYGILAVLCTMCVIDRRNVKQKILLATVMYLFRWLIYGAAMVLRNILYALFITAPYMQSRPMAQFVAYIIEEILYYGVSGITLYMVTKLIHKVYVNKKEDISGKELLLLLATLMTVLAGYFTFTFFSNIYEKDTGNYVWNIHPEYHFLLAAYQLVSFAAILIAIVIYQRIKKKQREEKENVLLAEQIENTKSHIREVEKLYGDIRALKHDMGNHISVMENLFLKNEKDEFEKYLTGLKMKWSESTAEIKTGNPVTDVILTQRQMEAREKGINFKCKFYYPSDTSINAFDVSVILNNAISNAFAGIDGCKNPYVFISTYRKKNAYMIEVKNCIAQTVEIDEETGLPDTTKKDKDNHGFGLANIRKVAQQYCGDIDIEQDENNFLLTIMLMVE